jgi:flagellar motor switch protein FliG
MTTTNSTLRKAAVLIRSVDAETAATMLAQLTRDEAAALRAAIRALGPIDIEEEADVAAEFRRISPLVVQSAADGVELNLSSWDERSDSGVPRGPKPAAENAKRFEFLDQAPIDALVPYLAREHVQTIALVLSHLRPARAAAVLSALPKKAQADTLERLAALGETDPDSVIVVEQELAAWLARRCAGRPSAVRRDVAVSSILAAADDATRGEIIANLRTHKAELAERFAPTERREPKPPGGLRTTRVALRDPGLPASHLQDVRPIRSRPQAPKPQPPLRIDFDELIHVDGPTLAAVVSGVDAKVLVLALAGSREDLIERICRQMPKRLSRMFRRQLRRLGPTRLSDVEEAQRAVALAATQKLAARRGYRFAAASATSAGA